MQSFANCKPLAGDETRVGLGLYILIASPGSPLAAPMTPAPAAPAGSASKKPKTSPTATPVAAPVAATPVAAPVATVVTPEESAPTEKKAPSYERRDQMRETERKIQALWEQEGTFQVDAKQVEGKEKYFCSFPYPYMNGRLHLGHAFTITKADFMAGYQRLRGKHVLFPFAFHCTGMPISAAATKLRRELDNPPPPPPTEEETVEEPAVVETTVAKPMDGKFVSKKSKTAKKTGVGKTQAEILMMSGITKEEVPKFRDPRYWLDYFPPLGEVDLRSFGLLCDWRRSFITTDANPYYDSFIRWQFKTLFARGKVMRGKRPTICTPDDGQACADHDRAEGEGVQFQEYTLVKMKVEVARPETVFAQLVSTLVNKQVSLVAATLRPETMFGQTNCYVLPMGDYGLYQVSETEVFVCGEHSAINLAFQGFPGENGELQCLGKVKGADIVGTVVIAPLSLHGKVHVLPMDTVSMKMGTAVVTSVPSDSPDDFMTYSSLQTNDKFRTLQHVDPAWVQLPVVHIIDIPNFNNQPCAPQLCERLKIKSPKDTDKLEKAKDEAYLHGFEFGQMTQVCSDALPNVITPGMKVKDAKPLVRQYLLDNGLAIKYWEPAKYVFSRSGYECIVKHLDQWYLPYGEEEWKQQVLEHVHSNHFNAFAGAKQFDLSLDWLREWACSRSFGLGTKLPAFTSQDRDGEFVIESLSDSTIYMAYYTIAHLLQCGPNNYDAKTPTSQVLTPEAMSCDGVWDYVFLLSPTCPFPPHSQEAMELGKMRNEFEYWYPLDLRVSGKDLIQNHLSMSLYNHTAIWNQQPELWPRAFFTNGHILVEAEKMAKQKGNFILMHDAIAGQETMKVELSDGSSKIIQVGWTADATRVALADGGDGLDDANFSSDVADNAVMRLFSELRFAVDALAEDEIQEDVVSPILQFHQDLFDADMDVAIELVGMGYESMRYRDALKDAFFVLPDARDRYRKACALLGKRPNKQYMIRFVQVFAQLLAPICPHYSENVWRNVLKQKGSVFDGGWPILSSQTGNKLVRKTGQYLVEVEKKARTTIDKAKQKSRRIEIGVAKDVQDWHVFVCQYLKQLGRNLSQNEAMTKLSEAMRTGPHKQHVKEAMKVAPKVFELSQTEEGDAAYETAAAFDEIQLLEMYAPLMAKILDVDEIHIVVESPERCSPGKPVVKLIL
ncbi:leucine-tRNA ligase [Batrachochytrium salamandrivorans]|nr:leucine-tRNA ligase [Batrachochytrium salamandrivorans]